MKKLLSVLKGTRLRTTAAVLFFLAAVAGLVWHTGWGTASSFGIADIAAVCPLGALESMLAAKTFIPRALAALVVFFIAAMLFGRFFCGWLCPVPLVGKLSGRIGRRRAKRLAEEEKRAVNDEKVQPVEPAVLAQEASVRGAGAPSSDSQANLVTHTTGNAQSACASCGVCTGKGRAASPQGEKTEETIEKTPYVILGGALASSAVFGFPVFCLICPVGLTFALVIALWQLFEFNQTNWAILWFAGFLVLELFVLRRWCGKFCPLGALMTIFARLNRTFRPAAETSRCTRVAQGTDCTVCRDVCPEGIDPAKAKSNPWLLARCTKCGACAEACPSGAIHFPFFAKNGPETTVSNAKVVPILPVTDAKAPGSSLERLNAQEETAALLLCVHCGECGEVCPLGDRMPKATALLARGRRDEAAEVVLAAGGMPEITSRVCPTERFCEGACAQEHRETGAMDGRAVPIASLERTLAESALEAGWRPTVRRSIHARRVAIVGAGPAGLACADVLARLGVEVHVIDEAPLAGGLLTFGIPAFKLPHEVVAHRLSLLEDMGVRFALNLKVGRDIQWADLAKEFDAVFIGTGAGVPVMLDVPGALSTDDPSGKHYAPGVIAAGDFLARLAADALGVQYQGPKLSQRSLEGLRVVVLGGGDTALDAARTALRAGAASVICVSRRPESTVRARRADLLAAKSEGVQFRFEASASQVLRASADDVVGVALSLGAQTKETEVAGASGATEEMLPADLVVVAYGFHGVVDEGLATLGVRFNDRGAMETTTSGRTGADRIWAGGDAVRGPALVSLALADGRRAGLDIAQALGVIS